MSNQQYFYPCFLQFQELAGKEAEKLRELLRKVDAELSHAPPGSLMITQKGNRTWYYQRYTAPGARPLYLNEQESFLRHALAQKAYDQRLRREIVKQLRMLERGAALQLSDLTELYETFPEAWRGLIVPRLPAEEQFVEQWKKSFEDTASGEPFKSKAEFIHDSIYEKLSIVHVYEPYLFLEGYGPVRPDFAALNRRTRQTFFHEHFGMMDDPDYCRKALAKLGDYHRNGYYEGENLLITMESSRHPMDPEDVEKLFRARLL